VSLLNFSYLRLAETNPQRHARRRLEQMAGQGVSKLPLPALVALQLFAGETTFATTGQKGILQQLVSPPSDTHGLAKTAAIKLPIMRGLGFNICMSDLENACRIASKKDRT
jgi:hypothetical protein